MTLGGRQYQVWFTSDEEGHWAFKAECDTGDKHIGRFIWSPNTHREQGLDSSGGFNWLPGTQWRWVQIEEDLVQFLPQGWLRTREDHCAHWHQLEGHGECCIYVSGRRYHAQFEETTKHAEGISARTFTAKQLSGKMHFGLSEVRATKCLPLPTTERGVTCGYIMKRSGLIMSEWKARCHPPTPSSPCSLDLPLSRPTPILPPPCYPSYPVSWHSPFHPAPSKLTPLPLQMGPA